MRLAFLLQPRADSAFVLCHTRAAETTGPRLWCTASGASVIFSLENIQKKHPDGELWRLVLAILMRGRDLILEYRPWQENGEEGSVSPEEFVAALERCPCLLPLHVLGSYRSLDSLQELIILFVAQGSRFPSPLPQADILKKLPLRDWMLFACPNEKNFSGKLSNMAALLEVNPSLAQRLDKLAADWTRHRDLRCIPLEQGKGWIDRIAHSLHMVHLDRFCDSSGPARKNSPLTWERDVFPAVLGSGAPFPSSGTRPPILSGSMLESALSPETREQLFFRDSGSPREKVRHVILQGATGTGKSTLGRLLLMHEVLHDDTARVVYMGPTRMLVEESYAAFCELAAEFSQQEDVEAILPEHIVISTGERAGQDDRIRNGDFRALFIVYEKLNNFFHDTTLIRHINCVMVDEVQMICDYTRGGILDIILTSLCHEADRRFDEDNGLDFLRLIICTTEHFDLKGRLTIHPGFREKDRFPLILEDRQHFRKPDTWFQFRVNKKFHSLPTAFDDLHVKKSLIAPHPGLKYVSFRTWGDPLIYWLKEWMWGHEKVLYVHYSPAAMLALARKLVAKGRPDMVTDETWLARLHDALLQEAFNEQYCEQIVTCARKGIFFNFSTMGYAARGISASMFRACPYQQGVPVIAFATSTIMYGVNLPADLLILKELVWPQAGIEASFTDHASTASPLGSRFAYLRPCEMRNIAGRVGRQGLASPHIVPTVLYSNFVPATEQQLHSFQKFIKGLDASEPDLSFILDRKRFPPQQLADFSPVQQRFLMNSLLHSCNRERGCSLERLQDFIASTWAWERVRRDCETEDWRQYIADFFTLLQQDFPECLRRLEIRGKTLLIPLPLCYSVCQTGSDLATLKELQELLDRWDMAVYPQKAHAAIVLLSLVMTRECWTLFLDFHQESKWGQEELEDEVPVFRLKVSQQACLEATGEQEKIVEEKFRSELRTFMDERAIEVVLLQMRQILTGKDFPMSLGKNIAGMEVRKVLMAFRSALALLAWCRGGRGEDITKYHYAAPQDQKRSESDLLYEHASFKDKFVMRLAYTLSAMHVYCEERNVDKSLVEAIDEANNFLQKGQLI